MRKVLFLVTCLSLLICVIANNLIIGKRDKNEVLIMDEDIIKPRIFGRPQIGICTAKAPSGHVISYVSVTHWNPWVVGTRILKGGLGKDFIVVSAASKPSWGIRMKCIILAKPKKDCTTTTTSAPTTTTTPAPTTTTTPAPTTTTTPAATTTTTPAPTTTTTPAPTTTTPAPTTTTTPAPSTTTTPAPTTTTTPAPTTTTTPAPTTTTPAPTTTPDPTTTTTWEPTA